MSPATILREPRELYWFWHFPMRQLILLLLLAIAPSQICCGQDAEPAKQWIDPDTGHRIVRLSEEPGSRTLYFHDNAYTPQGDKLIINTPRGIAAVDVASIGTATQKVDIVVSGGAGQMARRSREVYVAIGSRGGRGFNATQPTTASTMTGGAMPGGRGIYAINIDTKQRRLIPNAPSTIINCDETSSFVMLRGESAIDPTGKTQRPTTRPYVPQLQRMFPGKKLEELTADQQYSVAKEDRLARGTLAPPPAAFAFIDLKTGQRTIGGYQFANIDHQQFNPADPSLLLFAHEGTWHEVDRTWTIRTDGSGLKLMHRRTMDMEINGHEWWSWDGKTIWYDLQTPRSQDFWIGGVNIETGKETRYHIDRDSWGVHFNSSRDDSLFASDGGDPSQVAYSTDGMWINLFRVQPDGTVAHGRLVNMQKHNYVTGARGGVEPNCSITPDKKWVIFTGQFAPGQRHVYAVEIAKRN
jgi:oligogalacturonide lyase